MNISEMVQELKAARVATQEASDALTAYVQSYASKPEYQALQQAKVDAVMAENELEQRIKETAVGCFDGENKHPAPFVNIVMRTIVKIVDIAKAREWCAANLRDAFKLDEKIVGKYAKEIAPIPGVTVTQEPQAQIASVIE